MMLIILIEKIKNKAEETNTSSWKSDQWHSSFPLHIKYMRLNFANCLNISQYWLHYTCLYSCIFLLSSRRDILLVYLTKVAADNFFWSNWVYRPILTLNFILIFIHFFIFSWEICVCSCWCNLTFLYFFAYSYCQKVRIVNKEEKYGTAIHKWWNRAHLNDSCQWWWASSECGPERKQTLRVKWESWWNKWATNKGTVEAST